MAYFVERFLRAYSMFVCVLSRVMIYWTCGSGAELNDSLICIMACARCERHTYVYECIYVILSGIYMSRLGCPNAARMNAKDVRLSDRTNVLFMYSFF